MVHERERTRMLTSFGAALLILGATFVDAQGVQVETTPGVIDPAATTTTAPGVVDPAADPAAVGTTPGVVDPAAATTPGVAATTPAAVDPNAAAGAGAIPANLVGTWSSKSNKTLTGPGFYDPRREKLIEPSHTGISYSFTQDGFYEVAYYRAIANPVNPACPGGIMQWQHGKFQILSNGSLTTQPFEVDGRQLLSEPCDYDNGIYTRYNQSELFERFELLTDPYHNIPRLNLFRFDGSPVMPLYLAYNPPEMLPTSTLNPTTASGSAQAASTSSSKFRLKRTLDEWQSKFAQRSPHAKRNAWISADALWWFGVSATGLGSVMYFCF